MVAFVIKFSANPIYAQERGDSKGFLIGIRFVILSDTHGKHWSLRVPAGDILIHAGDLTRNGTADDLEDFNSYLGTLPHRHKVVIAGNHDFCLESEPEHSAARITNAIYLQDQAVTVEGIKFYGSPWQPWFYDWAFNLERGAEIRAKWDLIPEDTDVLITHGPAYGILDQTTRGERVGCEELLDAIKRIRPRMHVFGHIHEAYGIRSNADLFSINASNCDVRFSLVNPPIIQEFDR